MKNCEENALAGLSPEAFERELKKLQKQAESDKSIRMLASASARILRDTLVNDRYAENHPA